MKYPESRTLAGLWQFKSIRIGKRMKRCDQYSLVSQEKILSIGCLFEKLILPAQV